MGFPGRRGVVVVAAAAAALVALSGCATAQTQGAGDPVDSTAPVVADFPVGAGVDYQLGGAYPPPDGVGIVARDSTAEPASGVWSICYVNGFQSQPGDEARFEEVLLRDAAGAPVADPDWPDEYLFDTSTDGNRALIAAQLDTELTRCADAGFDAVEFDNLDTFTRDPRVTFEGNLALAAELVARAHELGLAAGQKNTSEFTRELHERAGFDFAVVEECVAYEECGSYTSVYGDAVVAIEYTDSGATIDEICASPGHPASLVLRDRDLVPAGEAGYAFALCPAPPAS
ncbi:endo alpha-1,4 polygalactosaminidase [Homoserinibacter sp. GY 40078]|uniref:endo alpha-1,4 polygalactosaminidase n=1 Tax=Homoserinibacter sp. GY 40078 TaxID=2603275 RepID=UPI0011CC091E|nr:endo alpha-1,4 polygalactosaminidase [Homoserinibacter sp. GY 40078]TXK17039.1 endo alpha-1,4 polygalactosaminidase [Homoserinibacter sp. GY 40078]